MDLLQEFPVYDELNIIQMSKARTYNVEIIDSKDPLEQWEANKSSIKDLLKDLLDKTKIFKYQITLKVLLRKHKQNRDLKFAPVYFNSTTKTIIGSNKYVLDKSFEHILYSIDNWINERSGWLIVSVDAEYVNILVYSPLSESAYIKLSRRLRNSMKGLINIRNSDIKCFLWCHIRHLNSLKTHPERITKAHREMVNDLD